MAEVSIRFTNPGTRNYTVGNDVVGGVMKMEAIGAGGAGGTATVNSGGGGKGGAYARRNAQAVTAGQTLTVTVAATSTTTGQNSQIQTGGGASRTVSSKTFTYNAPPATTGTTPGIGLTVELSGSSAPVFRAASNTTNTAGVLIPTVQAGDYIFVLTATAGLKPPESGFVRIYERAFEGNARVILLDLKVSDGTESGTRYTGGTTSGATVCSVYSGVTEYSPPAVTEKQFSGSDVSLTCSGFTTTKNSIAAFFYACVASGTSTISGSTPEAGVTERAELSIRSGSSEIFTSAISDTPTQATALTTILLAAGGNVGGNGSATAGGTGATAQNGTSTGDVTFTGGNGANGTLTAGGRGGGGAGDSSNTTGPGPNTQFGVSGGTGGLSATAGQVYGGGGGGATTLAARGSGASGIVVLTYSTGVGQTSPTSVFSRLATLFRVANNGTTLTSIFNRVVTISRAFSNTTTLQSDERKQIQLPRSATTSPLAAITKKAVSLFRTATIVHTPTHRKDLTLGAKVATTENRSLFARAVTIRRTFQAITRPVGKLFLFLEARLIPREGGGVTNIFRNLFLFDD